MSENKDKLDIHLREYEKCKVEQMARIAFRDNLVYVTLAAYGGIVAFAAKDNHLALLVLPWVSLVLGWGYLVNDEKVSAIGRYVRIHLTREIAALISDKTKPEDLLGWEIAHRSDSRRKRRKVEQLIIDLICFVFSGLAAIVAFWLLDTGALPALKYVAVAEGLALFALGIEIVLYADLKSGR